MSAGQTGGYSSRRRSTLVILGAVGACLAGWAAFLVWAAMHLVMAFKGWLH